MLTLNYGTHSDEVESEGIKIAGLICRNFSYNYSRPLADDSLKTFSQEQFDRNLRRRHSALVSHIRDNGAQNAVITTEVDRLDELRKD